MYLFRAAYKLNNNMRCFEIKFRHVRNKKTRELNNNMRCFEILNLLKHPKMQVVKQ